MRPYLNGEKLSEFIYSAKNIQLFGGIFGECHLAKKICFFHGDTERWGLHSKKLKILLEENALLTQNWFLTDDAFLHVNKILADDEIC